MKLKLKVGDMVRYNCSTGYLRGWGIGVILSKYREGRYYDILWLSSNVHGNITYGHRDYQFTDDEWTKLSPP